MMITIRIWRVVLIASLATNLFVGGFVAAQEMRGDRLVAPPVAATTATQNRPVARPPVAIPTEVRPAVARVVEQNDKLLRPNLTAVRKANELVTAALMAEPFDAERLNKALERLRSATTNSQRALHVTMIETIASMTPEQRRLFAEATKGIPPERAFLQGR